MSHHHETYFPEESFDEPTDFESDNSSTLDHELMVEQLGAASAEVRRRYDGEWDADHEQELATIVQAGLAAESTAVAAGDNYDGALDELIDQGKQARHDLVVANLPFAAYMARASVGIRSLPHRGTSGVPAKQRSSSDYMGKLKEPGTFARIANLAHPGADLVDRTQVAMEAMWKASGKYRARSGTDGKGAKFITYAAWHVHNDLYRHMATEVSGWDVDRSTFDKYMTALEEEELYGTAPVMTHNVLGKERHAGLHPTQMLKGRKAIPLNVVDTGVAEESNIFEDNEMLPLEDVVPSQAESAHKRVEEKALQGIIEQVFDTLSEREAGIIEMRLGLDDGTPKTLAEVGKAFGITKDRVMQIESKTMAKIRHPYRSELLRDFLDDIDEDTGKISVPTEHQSIVDGGPHIKTRRLRASGGRSYGEPLRVVDEPQESAETGAHREGWKASDDEHWDDPVRSA